MVTRFLKHCRQVQRRSYILQSALPYCPEGKHERLPGQTNPLLGQVVSRETLAREVWREKARSLTLDNVIDTHVARLRKKIDADHQTKLIHTIRGVGFMMREGEV